MTKRTLLVLAALSLAGAAQTPPTAAELQANNPRQLRTVRRVFVDRLTGGETAAQMRDILISSLAGAELFILTENQEKADCILRGASEDLVFNEVHQSSDGINAHASLGTGRTAAVSAAAAPAETTTPASVSARTEPTAPATGVTKPSRLCAW